MGEIKAIIVDDNLSFRNALKDVLKNKFSINIIGEAGCGEEFMQLPYLYQADVILMDLNLPDTDGIQLVKQSLNRMSGLKFIAITMYNDEVYLLSLIGAGFKGCVFKQNIFSEVNHAITNVLNGRLQFPKNIMLTQ